MKKILLSGLTMAAMAGAASATLLTESWSGSQDIPEGNPVGTINSLSVSDPSGAAIEGYNGNLYGYLVFQPSSGGAASMEVLLDQIGTGPGSPFGSATSGFNVTLSDSGTQGDIHNATGTAGQSLTGSYTPDSANTMDGTFGGVSADGTWTLFLANLSEGGGTSTLVGWGVGISVVPEPVTWALVGFAGILVVAGISRHRSAGRARTKL